MCGGELDEEGVCLDCGFDTSEGEEDEEEDEEDEDEDWGED